VLAAILICGASVFTSCSEGGDNPAPPSSKDRKDFIEHTRNNLKYMAENVNFSSWEGANAINIIFNQYVLNNPEFEKAIIPLFLKSIAESTQPVEEGSELAEMGFKMYATIDLTEFNYRFTVNDDITGFDVEEADDFEIILHAYDFEKDEQVNQAAKIMLKADGDKYKKFVKFLSTDELAVIALIPESFYFAISDKLSGSWRDVFTGAFTNEIKTSDPEKIIFLDSDGFTVAGIVTSNVPASQKYGKPADETTLSFSIDTDKKNHEGLVAFAFEQNGQLLVKLTLKESGEGLGGIANIDLSQLTSSSSIADVLAALWLGRSIDEGKITLLDDLTTTFSVSDMQKVLQLQNEMAHARRNYADQATIEGYTRQLNELVKGTMTCKGVNQEIPMRLATTKIGVDWWAVPALKFADEQGYVPLTDMLDKESVEYAFNIIDHAVEPMQQSIITVRQLLQFVQTYMAQLQRSQSQNSEE
jgi:hypothetical protein